MMYIEWVTCILLQFSFNVLYPVIDVSISDTLYMCSHSWPHQNFQLHIVLQLLVVLGCPFFIAKTFFHGYHTFFILHAHGDVHMSLIKLTALLEYKIGIKWN